jgi:hypothetical protein
LTVGQIGSEAAETFRTAWTKLHEVSSQEARIVWANGTTSDDPNR